MTRVVDETARAVATENSSAALGGKVRGGGSGAQFGRSTEPAGVLKIDLASHDRGDLEGAEVQVTDPGASFWQSSQFLEEATLSSLGSRER